MVIYNTRWSLAVEERHKVYDKKMGVLHLRVLIMINHVMSQEMNVPYPLFPGLIFTESTELLLTVQMQMISVLHLLLCSNLMMMKVKSLWN